MKKILPFLFVLFTLISNAQIVNIPDAAFKNALLNPSFTETLVDTNHDGEIQTSEAAAVNTLWLDYYSNIFDLTGIQSFVNLKELSCGLNQLSTLDVSGLPLNKLFCPQNNLTTLNITGCTELTSINCSSNLLSTLDITEQGNLTYLECSANQLSTLNVSSNTALVVLGCSQNQLSNLDLTASINLEQLFCGSNQLNTLDLSNTKVNLLRCMSNQLTYLNVKNNLIFDYTSSFEYFNCSGNPALQYVCADEGEILFILNNLISNNILNARVDANCSLSASTGYTTITGSIKIDTDNNGCTSTDSSKRLVPLKLINDSDTLRHFYTRADSSGNFNFYTSEGNYSLVPSFQSPYFIISPDTLHFTAVPNTSQQLSFCIIPNGIHNDLAVTIDQAYAWIDIDSGCNVKLSFTNKGTQALSGTVELNFDESKLDFLTANIPINNQTAGQISWNFYTLLPLETRTIDGISFLTPGYPINMYGDILTFVAAVNPSSVADETPADNSFTYQAQIQFVLPISIEYFKGTNGNNKNQLKWKANCSNTGARFEIERSADSRKFVSIGNIYAGQLRCKQAFDFIDHDPPVGLNYYRIKMKDDAGKISYSNVIALLNKKTGFEIISMSPNPVTGETATLNITSARTQQISIKIIDVMGRSVYAVSKKIAAGSAQIEMNLNKLSKGIYHVNIHSDEGDIRSLRFLKQ